MANVKIILVGHRFTQMTQILAERLKQVFDRINPPSPEGYGAASRIYMIIRIFFCLSGRKAKAMHPSSREGRALACSTYRESASLMPASTSLNF